MVGAMQETPDASVSPWPCLLGRPFGPAQLAIIREQVRLAQPTSREEVARRVCAALQWRAPGGALPVMSAKVALLRLHRRGLIALPPPRSGRNNENRRLGTRPVEGPAPPVVSCRADQLGGLRLHPVASRAEAQGYRAWLQQYHYLGYSATAGAQLRYLISSDQGVLGVMGFGAAAWKVQARDAWIGWGAAPRRARLHLVVNHTRFLLLPWVRCANLGSKVLALAARRVGADWRARYGYSPVLLETFVQCDRFTGGVYRAANWQCVGHTQGRGRNSKSHAPAQPVKSVWVYPLSRHFRSALGGAPGV